MWRHEETLKKVGSQNTPIVKMHVYFFANDHTIVKLGRLPSSKKFKMVCWVTFKDLRQVLHLQIAQ